MQDPLIAAARCFGVATDVSAGPGQGPDGRQLWARWPRNRLEIAHEALRRVVYYDRDAGVAPGPGNIWRAYARGWSYEGDFPDAVATLALHVAKTRGLPCAVANSRRAGIF